jgi:hypothetical protein
MRIIGPPYYKPEITCLRPPFEGQKHHLARLKEERRGRLEKLRRYHEARLRCPDCGDSMKVLLNRRWLCRHCLIAMV